MDSIKIRKVKSGEIDELVKISRQTFHDTLAAVNTEENRNRNREDSLSRGKLKAKRENQNAEFYFAELIKEKDFSKAKSPEDEIYPKNNSANNNIISEQIIGYLKLKKRMVSLNSINTNSFGVMMNKRT